VELPVSIFGRGKKISIGEGKEYLQRISSLGKKGGPNFDHVGYLSPVKRVLAAEIKETPRLSTKREEYIVQRSA